MPLPRRQFMAASASPILGDVVAGSAPQARKRIAFIGTEVRTYSHPQEFLDRFALGYTWSGGWQAPRLEVASVYIDQISKGDLAKSRIAKYRLKQVSSVADALTLGTSKLAVDGVVIIGEHGNYPMNAKGQRLYPRYRWFQEIVKVFEQSGRACPVFNDKHLSTDWDECVQMVDASRRLGFPFLAGSSLSVTWRLPSIDVPWGAPLEESVCVGYGFPDGYDLHCLETAQCMSERRRGGEVGIRSVHAMTNERLWEELAKPERETTRRLMTAGFCRSNTLPVDGGYPSAPVTFDWIRKTMPAMTAYFIEHRDGFRTSMIMAPIQDFNYAGLRKDTGEIISCQMYLPLPLSNATTADFFNPLVRHIETMVVNGRAPFPVERTLLTSGMVIGGVESLHAGQVRFETPKMQVAYMAPMESTYWRE